VSTVHGEGVALIEERQNFDPAKGYSTQLEYGGEYGHLRAFKAAKEAEGWLTSWSRRDGIPTLVITSADPTGDPTSPPGGELDVAYDDWSIETEWAEIDLWADEKLRAWIIGAGFATSATAEIVLSAYRSTITEHANHFYDASGAKVAGSSGPTPLENFVPKNAAGTNYEGGELNFLKDLYAQIIGGSNKSRVARIVLRRRRRLKASSALRYSTDAGQRAWETPNLIAAFGIPPGLAAKLPETPNAANTPVGTRWAWALQAQTAESQGSSVRILEQLAWVFAPCRIFTFEFNPPI
jgi:hypothetical protein